MFAPRRASPCGTGICRCLPHACKFRAASRCANCRRTYFGGRISARCCKARRSGLRGAVADHVDGMGAALGSTVMLFWDRTLGRQLLEGHWLVRPAPALCAYPRRETGVVVRHWYSLPLRCNAKSYATICTVCSSRRCKRRVSSSRATILKCSGGSDSLIVRCTKWRGLKNFSSTCLS
jgi:hypothetical protein